MIHRLLGFFSSQQRHQNVWLLPLSGLLLTVGCASYASTVEAVPHDLEEAKASTTVAKPAEVSIANVAPVTNSTAVVQPEEVSIANVAPITTSTAIAQPEEVSMANVAPITTSTAIAQPEEVSMANIAQVPVSTAKIADGVYLYGQSSEPGEMGKEYIVFESRQGKVVGAMYLPNSEYTCFYGTLDSKQMNLTVVNPYDQSAFSHKIARTQPTQLAAAGGQINIQNGYNSLKNPYAVGLEGYQAISKVSENDQRILGECRENYKAQVWNE